MGTAFFLLPRHACLRRGAPSRPLPPSLLPLRQNWLRLSDNRLTGKVPETFRSTALRLNQLT